LSGRAPSPLSIVFLVFDSGGKLLKAQPFIDGTIQLGYQATIVFPLGVILLVCVVAYMIPATSVLGAVLLTGYLGVAVATHARVEDPLLSHTLFPIYFGCLIW